MGQERASTRSGTGPVYRVAPALVAACLLAALALLPAGGRAGLGLGHDAFVLVGLLALARFALAAAAWDTGNGFALMGAARDLSLAVFGEALLVLALLLAAQPAHSTDLVAMSAAARRRRALARARALVRRCSPSRS